MTKHVIKLACIGLVVLLLLSEEVAAAGLGVAPSKIEISDAFRGGEYRRTIMVSNVNDDEATFSLNVSGECVDWVYSYNTDDPTTLISNITIPGKEKAKILLVFKIPNDAENRIYNTTINIQGMPSGVVTEGVGVGVSFKIPISVTLGVTGVQKLTGEVRDLRTTDVEVNYPLRIKIEFLNTGNVVAKPSIKVVIIKDNITIDTFAHADTMVKPNERAIIPIEWDTTGKESGDYEANVTVSLGEKVLATKDLQFRLLPVGTLSRQGNLTDIFYEGEPSVGNTLKILATFRNTGEIDTKAKFIGEVYVDGELIDTMSSEDLLVPVRETGTLTAYLKIETPSSYVIKGHAVYEGKTTETKELSFDVATESEPEPTPKSKPFIPGFRATGVIIAIASVMEYLIYRRRRSM